MCMYVHVESKIILVMKLAWTKAKSNLGKKIIARPNIDGALTHSLMFVLIAAELYVLEHHKLFHSLNTFESQGTLKHKSMPIYTIHDSICTLKLSSLVPRSLQHTCILSHTFARLKNFSTHLILLMV